jgi:sugar-specific transcriptional regulator TrmB
VRSFGPDDRDLLRSDAARLYEEIVAEGGIKEGDPRIAAAADQRPAFDLLLGLGLVSPDREAGVFHAVDPGTVQSRVVAPLGQEGARLLDESSQWAQAFGALAQAWRKSPETARGPFSVVHDEAIDPFIAGLVAECEDEMLTAQPQTGRDRKSLAAATARDTALLERGMRIRTLYQHSARRHAITRKYVEAVTERGAEVRTLDEFFNRMIIFDQRIAVIPVRDHRRSAMAVREPSIVAYLADIFERTWERARPFTLSRESSTMSGIAGEQRAMTIRMLIEGHADPVSAKRLGVSARTYAGYVADLKEAYEADTRFQLGYTMGQLGVSGNEHHDQDSGQGRKKK